MSLARAGLHLAALSSFTIAWRYFEPLSHGSEIVVEHSATRLDLILFVLLLVLGPPALLVVLEAAAGLVSMQLREALHLAFVGGFLALFAWQVLDDLGTSDAVIAVIGLPLAAATALAYHRRETVRSFVTFLSIGPVLMVVFFLGISPMRALVLSGEGSAPVRDLPPGPPVVMIVLDELPVMSLMDGNGRVDPVRYPNFARFSRDATWYRAATTVGDLTPVAVPPLLTGNTARHGELPVEANHPDSLFRLLGGTYRLRVLEWTTYLCSASACPTQVGRSFEQRMRSLIGDLSPIPVFPRPIRKRVGRLLRPDVADIRERIRAQAPKGSFRWDVPLPGDERVAAFLRTFDRSEEPTLHYLHLVLPHSPWTLLPDGRRYIDLREHWMDSFGTQWEKDPRATAVAYQRHLLQLEFTDRLLGSILRRVERIGAYDRSLVVLAADHGVSFGAGQKPRIVTAGNVHEIAPVPLMIKSPMQKRGRIDDAFVQTIDVLPTIADELGVRLPWRTEGRPAARVGRSPGPRTLWHWSMDGGVRFEPGAVERRRAVVLRRKLRLFGKGDETRRMYALGGHSKLLGRRVDRLTVAERGRITATLDEPERFRSVVPDGPEVPAVVSGLVRGGTGVQRRIAVAVNGAIATTAWTLRSGQDEYYTSVLPPSTLRPGQNSVGVFAISGRGHDLRLVPLLRGEARPSTPRP